MAEPARLATHCPLDCPDACSLDVTVVDGRVVRLEGATDRNPVTDGYICSKVRRYPEHVHGPERIRRPQRRTEMELRPGAPQHRRSRGRELDR